MRICGADGFGDHVLNAHGFENRPHGTARNNAGTRRRGPEDDTTGAVAALNVVVERAAFAERYLNHVPLCLIGRLADGLGCGEKK